MIQHLAPELARPLSDAGDGRAKPFRVTALREGWAWAPRHWTEVTADTGVGNPRAATPEKGAAYFKAVTGKLAGFFGELAAADLDSMYGD
jgi:creatinine amidohydrolase